MKRAEEVTFAGTRLDRAAGMRGGATALIHDPATRILPLWRGKPLLRDGDGAHPLAPAWIAEGHALLKGIAEPILLGRMDGIAWFAADVSDWSPDALPDTLGAFADPSEQGHPDLDPACRFRELRASMNALDPGGAELCVTARAVLEWHRTHGFCARCGAPSVIAEAGWQRECPACGAKHFPRTDPVVIMLVTYGNDLLIGRSPHWPPRMYSLLAGFVEPGETVEAAVRREVAEETGVRVGRVGYLASQPWPFPASLMLGCHAEATSRELSLDPVEIEDALWISREDLAAVFAGIDARIAPARKGAIAHFLMSNWLADTLD